MQAPDDNIGVGTAEKKKNENIAVHSGGRSAAKEKEKRIKILCVRRQMVKCVSVFVSFFLCGFCVRVGDGASASPGHEG